LTTAKPYDPDCIVVSEFLRREFVPLSNLAHGWQLYSALMLSPAEDRTMVREPVAGIPASIASRIGKLRVIAVPYIACHESGDAVCFSKPSGPTHVAVWHTTDDLTSLVLACREVDAHDTGFELLASIAELLRPRLSQAEMITFSEMLKMELQNGVTGEIDEDAFAAKQTLMKTRGFTANHYSSSDFAFYRDASMISTLAEYLHGLWHDVQVRSGPEHLPVSHVFKRMKMLSQMFPPNPGYGVFAPEFDQIKS
jgi:hypothetical protein